MYLVLDDSRSLQELNKYRAKCSLLFHYDWISIPLVYTQVRSIRIYLFIINKMCL